MKIATVQMSIENSIEKNFLKIKNIISELSNKGVELIVFPEMTLTGFDKNIVIKFDIVNNFLEKLSDLSDENDVGLIIGHPEKNKDKIYNDASIILPKQKTIKYRKINLTKEETNFFNKGNKKVTFNYKGNEYGVIICKDQNFPQLSADLKNKDIKALFILAGHYYKPYEARLKKEKNKAIPITRALENEIFVFKANTIGTLFNKISLGGSIIVDPKGIVINYADETSESILTYEILENKETDNRSLL